MSHSARHHRTRPAFLATLALSAAALLAGTSAASDSALGGESAPSLKPGASHRFARVDGIVTPDAPPAIGEREFFPSTGPSPSFALWNGDAPFDSGRDLRAAAIAFQALARARISVTRHNDFVLDAGDAPDAVVPAQVSATVRFRGFLALLGSGQAKAKATLKVIDVTTEDPLVVASRDIFEETIDGALKPTLGVDVGALIPVPDGQAAVSFEFETEGEKKLVNDDCDVSLPVLLQRGHRYRLLLELKARVRTGIAGGLADVEFWMAVPGDREARGLDPAPSLVDSRYWRKALECAEPSLSLQKIVQTGNLGLPQNVVTRFLGEIGTPSLLALQSRDEVVMRTTRLSSPRTIEQIFAGIGFPSRFTVGHFLDWLPKPLADADEVIDDLGVRMTDLSVSIGPDPGDAEAREIESDLAAGRVVFERVLPESRGGRLERVIELVDRRIDQARDAGLDPGQAALYLEYARQNLASGQYHRSYSTLVQAYAELTR